MWNLLPPPHTHTHNSCLPVQARALQGSAMRGLSLGLRVQSEALFSLLYSSRILQAINMWMSKGCTHLCALCMIHRANEFAGSEPWHLLLREGGLLFIKLKLCLLGAQRERNMAPYVGYPLLPPNTYTHPPHMPLPQHSPSCFTRSPLFFLSSPEDMLFIQSCVCLQGVTRMGV